MSCKFDQEIIHKYVDNTIEPLELIVLKEHIKVCEDCKLELQLMNKLEDSMYDYFIAMPEPDMLNKFSMEVLKQCYESKGYSYRAGLAKAWEINKAVITNASRSIGYIPGSKLAASTVKKLSKSINKAAKSYAKNSFKKLIGAVK